MCACRILDFGMTRSMVEEIEEDLPLPQKAPHLVRDQYSAFKSPRSSLCGRGSLKVTGHLSPSPEFSSPSPQVDSCI